MPKYRVLEHQGRNMSASCTSISSDSRGLRGNKALAGALSVITAAVVGVILNLSVWFALHTPFHPTFPIHKFGMSFDAPVLSSIDIPALLLITRGGYRDLPLQGGDANCRCLLHRRRISAMGGHHLNWNADELFPARS